MPRSLPPPFFALADPALAERVKNFRSEQTRQVEQSELPSA